MEGKESDTGGAWPKAKSEPEPGSSITATQHRYDYCEQIKLVANYLTRRAKSEPEPGSSITATQPHCCDYCEHIKLVANCLTHRLQEDLTWVVW